jgi:hypothetical protein
MKPADTRSRAFIVDLVHARTAPASKTGFALAEMNGLRFEFGRGLTGNRRSAVDRATIPEACPPRSARRGRLRGALDDGAAAAPARRERHCVEGRVAFAHQRVVGGERWVENSGQF